MATSNWTTPHPSTFILLGIPGLEEAHVWISIPFCSVYILSIVGNCLLLAVIKSEPILHEPMYLFLAMLAFADLVISTTAVPKTLCIFWFRDQVIHIDACLAQVFLIHTLTTMESGFMLAMAFDRYIAICNPLRHSDILTSRVIAQIGLGVVVRGAVLLGPHPFMLKQLPYCTTNVISHTYCEFMALVKLACVDTTAMRAYSLLVAFLTAGLDFILIILSYILILRAVFRLPSKEARRKSLSTCSSHVCVMIAFYTPAFFSFFSHRFGHVAPHVHILIANIYLLFPPMMNPLIYGVRTPGIRQRLLYILGLKRA
ncbi:olfactory receptor 52K2-like [Pelodiscus sinensis]|uniref:olfactory receptor 52K2-like n=1 Tax=Pelodiscus sinensis TaxID=13735 RepID=UPI0003C43C9D|nr:olfactory receptor 52K2-like [Pelodiscus sinensis]|eukprot:XP_006114269.1 olfactory receptor 52K2-like [Pelodiscus sinensis]